MKQRIERLFDEDKITAAEMQHLLARERHNRGALQDLKTKLDESFDDFKSRSYSHAKCRGRQHRWDMIPNTLDYRPIGAVFYETERCEQCGTVKITIINGLGRRDRTIYDHPIGYKLAGVRTTRSDWKILHRYMQLDFELMVLEDQSGEAANVVSLDRSSRTA